MVRLVGTLGNTKAQPMQTVTVTSRARVPGFGVVRLTAGCHRCGLRRHRHCCGRHPNFRRCCGCSSRHHHRSFLHRYVSLRTARSCRRHRSYGLNGHLRLSVPCSASMASTATNSSRTHLWSKTRCVPLRIGYRCRRRPSIRSFGLSGHLRLSDPCSASKASTAVNSSRTQRRSRIRFGPWMTGYRCRRRPSTSLRGFRTSARSWPSSRPAIRSSGCCPHRPYRTSGSTTSGSTRRSRTHWKRARWSARPPCRHCLRGRESGPVSYVPAIHLSTERTLPLPPVRSWPVQNFESLLAVSRFSAIRPERVRCRDPIHCAWTRTRCFAPKNRVRLRSRTRVRPPWQIHGRCRSKTRARLLALTRCPGYHWTSLLAVQPNGSIRSRCRWCAPGSRSSKKCAQGCRSHASRHARPKWSLPRPGWLPYPGPWWRCRYRCRARLPGRRSRAGCCARSNSNPRPFWAPPSGHLPRSCLLDGSGRSTLRQPFSSRRGFPQRSSCRLRLHCRRASGRRCRTCARPIQSLPAAVRREPGPRCEPQSSSRSGRFRRCGPKGSPAHPDRRSARCRGPASPAKRRASGWRVRGHRSCRGRPGLSCRG